MEKLNGEGMERDVEPGTDGIKGRELPSLQAVGMIEIVGRLPEVEDFITVLDWGIDGSQ